jgi:serine protease Do
VVGRTPVGKKVPVKVIRDGRKQTLWITLGELPEKLEKIAKDESSKTTSDNRLGIQVADLTKQQREELELEGGVLVEQVGQGVAGGAGIREGDIILRIEGKLIEDVDQFEELVSDLPAGKPVPILVQRRGGPIFLALKLPESE